MTRQERLEQMIDECLGGDRPAKHLPALRAELAGILTEKCDETVTYLRRRLVVAEQEAQSLREEAEKHRILTIFTTFYDDPDDDFVPRFEGALLGAAVVGILWLIVAII